MYWNAHRREWEFQPPEIEGPVELYRPTEDGTETLPPEVVDHEVEYHGEYDSLADAIDAIDCIGRWLLSTPDRGRYIARLDSVVGGVDVTMI
jgi:hypothetical protein